jgi:pyridinium-3,5-biscarboxylic acid mononucleotide sulfurtransferase
MREPLTIELARKLDHLRQILRSLGKTLIAYSGGVDSALVAVIAAQELHEDALACIGVSASFPQRELRQAVELAQQMKIAYRLVQTHEQDDPRYLANQGNRCFFCRMELFGRLREIAATEGWDAIADGVHWDDLEDHRNGIAAARENAVRSPLLEAQLHKQEVRDLARHLGITAWDKPAMACLASRVPHGTPIESRLLRRIEAAEQCLAELGFRQFRVRDHGDIARLEINLDEFSRAIELREPISAGVRAAGYRFVALDLLGFQSGSVSGTPQRNVRLPVLPAISLRDR